MCSVLAPPSFAWSSAGDVATKGKYSSTQLWESSQAKACLKKLTLGVRVRNRKGTV